MPENAKAVGVLLDARRVLLGFLLPTYVLSWSCWYLADHFRDLALNLRLWGFSAQIPLGKVLEVSGSCVPGLVVLSLFAITRDRKSRLHLWDRLIAWRVQPGYLFLAFALPCAVALLAVVAHIEAGGDVRFAGPAYLVFLNFVISLPQAPLWEEIGWRGYLFPKLQEHLSGFGASVIVGLVWGMWHLPLYFGKGPLGVSHLTFFSLFVAYVTALSVMLGWLYNLTRGSLPIVILLHEAANIPSKTLIGPNPSDQFRLFLWLCAFMWVTALTIAWAHWLWARQAKSGPGN